MVHGDGEVGSALVLDEVDHICFTGSAEVGRYIRRVCADSWHKTCSCEMGSKSAVMVFDDCNYELALNATLASAFKLSGQRCVSSGRLLIQKGIYEKFCKDFSGMVEKVTVGDPFDEPAPFMGPIINKQQADRVRKFNQMVRDDKAAKVLHDREKDAQDIRKGFKVQPFVYAVEWADKPYLQQEVFGPHVALVPFNDLEDAIRIYNDTDYGLALGVITNDFKKARECRNRCDFGLGYWNGGSIAAESHLPFGGVKKSGNGQASAAATFRAVTHEVSWTVNHGGMSFPQGLK
jgi:aldehyde dehydrogenase (NAD+)